MTNPDDYLAAALRQAMFDTAGRYQPKPDGLDQIRARINGRQPRPRLLSVLAGAVERIRYWTWRGHWIWPDGLPRLAGPAAARPASRSAPAHARRGSPRAGITGLRVAAALGAFAVAVAVSMVVQPFRHAIIEASSTMLNGGSGPQANGAGTDGNGTQAASPGGSQPSGASSSAGPGQHGSPGASGTARAGSVYPVASTACTPPTAAADAGPEDTSAATTPSPAATPQPGQTVSVTPTCVEATPTDAAPGDSWSPAPTDSSATWTWSYYTYTPNPTPTYSYVAPTPTYSTDTSSPTPTPTDTSTDTTPPPNGSPSPTSGHGGGSGGGGGGGHHPPHP